MSFTSWPQKGNSYGTIFAQEDNSIIILKLKTVFIICFFLFFATTAYSQVGVIDSLEIVLSKLSEDTNRVNFLWRFSYDISTSSPEKAEKYALEAIELGKRLSFERGIAKAYTALAISYYVRGDYASHSENLRNALFIYKELNDQEGEAKMLNNLGASFYAQGNYQKSLEYYFNALDIAEKRGMDRLNAMALNNIGEIYEKLDKPDQALEYYNKSYKIFNLMGGYEKEKAYILLNIGKIYLNIKEINLSMEYYKQALSIFKELGEKFYIADCNKNIGEVHFIQKNFDKALEYFNESLKIRIDIDDKQGIAECFLSIGKTHAQDRNALLSITYYNKSLKISREIGAKEIEMKTLRNLSDQEVTLGNFREALDYYKRQSILRDSILGIETQIQLMALQTKYNVEKKEQENEKLRLDNQLNEKKIQNQYYLGIMIGTALISSIILVFIFFKGREKQKQLNEELKNTQTQLVQSEKMASLGVLTAGIAHEINNPLNFVFVGINNLQKDFNDMVVILDEINKLKPGDDNLKIRKIEKLKEEYSYQDVIKRINQTTKYIRIGADRTAEIVKGLRDFSWTDSKELAVYDIHKGLNAALLLLRNKYKSRVEIVKNYDKFLPEIECFPGKLNQVFINILSNAIDAIPDKGEISIITQSKNKMLSISIKDNGLGMNEEIKSKIFDPFYTTKPFGKGTGLGMAITYGIIKDHKGNIEVKTEVGKGSEFIIYLPLKQKEREI